MQSDARKAHMRSFLFWIPVDVVGSWWWSMVSATAAWLLMENGGRQCLAPYPPWESSPLTLPSGFRWMWVPSAPSSDQRTTETNMNRPPRIVTAIFGPQNPVYTFGSAGS